MKIVKNTIYISKFINVNGLIGSSSLFRKLNIYYQNRLGDTYTIASPRF